MAAAVAKRSAPASRCTVGLKDRFESASNTVPETTPSPPTMMILEGLSLFSSLRVALGITSFSTNRTGALLSAATDPTPSASGKFSPVAT